MAVLDRIREQRGVPQCLSMDNGPDFIADTLRDWCQAQRIQASYCGPDLPVAEQPH